MRLPSLCPLNLIDEPTTGLDPRGRRDTWDAVNSLTADGVTVLLTTQYLEEADQLADSIAVIDHGWLVADGTAAALKERVGGSRIDIALADSANGAPARAALARAGFEAELDERGTRLTFAVETGGAGLARRVERARESGHRRRRGGTSPPHAR